MRLSPLLLALAMVLAGCSRHIEYSVANDGPQKLADVLVVSDTGHRFLHGILSPKAHTSFSGEEKTKKQNRFTLSWIEESGAPRKVEVEVSTDELTDRRSLILRITDRMTVEKHWRFEEQK